MSRLGKLPVVLPDGVQADIAATQLSVKGKLGSLSIDLHPAVNLRLEDQVLFCTPNPEHDQAKTMVGTMRSLAHNMVLGVSDGWEKTLQMVGVGYRANLTGNKLVVAVGYSHPRELIIPEGLTVTCPKPTEIVIKGCDKQAVGAFAAKVRMQRPPEPYKGKGIRYLGEYIAKKEGKKK